MRRVAVSEPFKSDLIREIAVLGAPVDIGASQRGTLMGPAALRTAGLVSLLGGLGFEVKDHGDLSIMDLAELADAVRIFLGGDHTVSMGWVNGVARHWRDTGREFFVLWLDAHADYNTPTTTLSGNMHGMSSGFLCGELGLEGGLGEEPRAVSDPDRIELFGVRSIDKMEKELL